MTKTTKPTVVVTALKVAELLTAVETGTVSKTAAIAELSRRIAQREAAGKHPMPFVVQARDELADTQVAEAY